MPRRKDQLPKSAINPANPLGVNLELARLGNVFYGNLPLMFYEILTGRGSERAPDQPDEAHGRDLFNNLLVPYLRTIVFGKKPDRLRQIASAFELVVNHIARGQPYNRTMLLATQYEIGTEERGERATGAGLVKFLAANGLTVDARYARQLRRRLVS